MIKNKIAGGFVATVLALAVAPICAFASTANGEWRSVTVSGVTYTGRSAVVSNGSKITGREECQTSQKVPASYIKTSVTLYRGGSSVGTAMGYNSSTSSFGYTTYTVQGWSGYSYSSKGYVGGFNPSTGLYYTTIPPMSPSVYCYASDAANTPELTSAELFGYETLEDGSTVGSAMYESVCGELPDWIMAVADDGTDGYVKAEDYWVPEAENPADAEENYSVRRVRTIPVYAAPESDEVIGSFSMYYGG